MNDDLHKHEPIRQTCNRLRSSGLIARACLVGSAVIAFTVLLFGGPGVAPAIIILLMILALMALLAFIYGQLIEATFAGVADLLEAADKKEVCNSEPVLPANDAVVAALDRLTAAVQSLPTAMAEHVSHTIAHVHAVPKDIAAANPEQLRDRLEAALELEDAEEVFELRSALVPQLQSADREALDDELAKWSAEYFFKSLRNGRAAIIVAAMARAVEDLGHHPVMQPIKEALPMVQMSANIIKQAREDDIFLESENGIGEEHPEE